MKHNTRSTSMNMTNAEYFTFNVDNSLFITGQTGSGKSYLVHSLIDRLQSAQNPEEVKFVLFNFKQLEFTETDPNFLLQDVITQ
jgi:DNA segregation ATPase FtsK/SpoIIIE-like protein